jgi:hypothetical protein
MAKGMNDHGAILCQDRNYQISSDQLEFYSSIALSLGRLSKSRNKGRPLNEHLSLTNSASLDSPRRAGGRAAGFGIKYRKWATAVPTETVVRPGFFNTENTYCRVSGTPVFKTMCRFSVSDDKLDLIESDNQFEIDMSDLTDFKYEDRISGLDQFTGHQMLQFSLEEGIRTGVLSGLPWRNTDRPVAVVGNPSVKVVPIGEPGFKTRTITASEDWVTQLLSPYGHMLISLLSNLTQAKSGLSAAAQLYEWVKRTDNDELDKLHESGNLEFLTSDLSQASENLEHDVSRALVSSYLKGAGHWTPYTRLSCELSTTPAFLERGEGPFLYEYTGFVTKRGMLMGLPGTKGTLTITMIVAEQAAFIDYICETYRVSRSEATTHPLFKGAVWRIFSCAGDDHLAIGPRRYLELIDEHLVKLGAVISIDKCYLSKKGAFFTEELVVKLPRTKFGLGKSGRLWLSDYEITVHVDSIKVRLLSRASKVSLLRDDKNPALGKCKDLAKKIAWLPSDFTGYKDLALSRAHYRFGRLVDWTNPMTYFPNYLGGIGLPYPSWLDQVDMLEGYLRLPAAVRDGITSVILKESDRHVELAIRLYASNTTYRGITMRTVAEEQIKFVFSQIVSDTVTGIDGAKEFCLGSLPEGERASATEWWERSRYRDKLNLMKRSGFTTLSGAIQEMERPTYFKEVLTGLTSRMKIDPTYLQYQESMFELDYLCYEHDLTFSECKSLFNKEYKWYESSRNAWFARQARYETEAFKESYDPVELGSREESTSGFNSEDMIYRPSTMDRIIRRHLTKRYSKYEQLEALATVLDDPGLFSSDLRPEVIFIKRERMLNMCSLRTPLN